MPQDTEWPVTEAHTELMARGVHLVEHEQLCLALQEIAYALRGLAIEQTAAAAIIADAIYSLQEDLDEGESDADDGPAH